MVAVIPVVALVAVALAVAVVEVAMVAVVVAVAVEVRAAVARDRRCSAPPSPAMLTIATIARTPIWLL